MTVRLLLFIGLLCSWSAQSQTPVIRTHRLPAIHTGWKFNALFQDHRGYCWLGAEQGLLRYDGIAYQEIALPDTLKNRQITALTEWKGSLYIGFRSGLIGILPLDKLTSVSKVSIWQPEEGLPVQRITDFSVDGAGDLWFSTYGEGVYCFKNNRLYQFDAADDGLSGDEVYALTTDVKGRIWVATDGGISICTMTASGQKSIDHITTQQGLPDDIVTALLPDPTGIWVGTYDRGICHYLIAEQRFDHFSPQWNNGPVNGLFRLPDEELWVASAEKGLWQLSEFTIPDPARNAASPAICRPLWSEQNSGLSQKILLPQTFSTVKGAEYEHTGDGIVWLIANQQQLYSTNAHFSVEPAAPTQVQAVINHRNGQQWIGTANGLFIKKNGRFESILPHKNNIIALYEDKEGNVWAGTFGQGILVLSPNGKVIKALSEQDGLANGSVLSITGDEQHIWLATLGGVAEIDRTIPPTWRIHPLSIGTSFIYAALADSKGRVWFGTDGKGLACLQNGQINHYDHADTIPLKTIYSLTEDTVNNLIWLSTDRSGIFGFDGQKFRHYAMSNGLHANTTAGIQASNGLILIAYEDGLDVLNPATNHIQFYGAETGWPQATINLNAISVDPLGNILLGAKEGIIQIHPLGNSLCQTPQAILTDVEVFLQKIDFYARTWFRYNENYFTFKFAGLWMAQPDAVRYRYRLDGFDLAWHETGDRQTAYPNLPPGTYIFRVEASANGRFGEGPETVYAFVVRPPFWQTWWFISLIIALISGILYSLIRLRERRINRDEQIQRERVEAQFSVLKSQINPHFLFNSFNTLTAIIEESPKTAVEYVEHLSDFYRNVMSYRERDTIPIEEELDLVRNFAFLLRKRYESGFELIIQTNGVSGAVLPFSLQILVENAVKHNIISVSKPLKIEILSTKQGYITVRNNLQPKIKPEPGTNFGLQSLRKRYELTGQHHLIIIQTETDFLVKVPILQNAGGSNTVSIF